NKEIRMTAPTAQGIPITYKDMTEKLPVHEFTHCLVMNFIDPSQIPIWLWEGVSLYEAEQKYDLTKTQYIKEKKLPAFEELNSYQKAFEFGYSLVEYIISKWGKNRLKDLITANGNIENALGISQEEFYNGWNEFLKKNY
ncbi:MAG: hypothetical protein MUP85_02485, partial [Candidatus Lokiarchaeota archaeon]|nr:hypothetical protein [Candidatus Lokiarchaeota archaeon]